MIKEYERGENFYGYAPSSLEPELMRPDIKNDFRAICLAASAMAISGAIDVIYEAPRLAQAIFQRDYLGILANTTVVSILSTPLMLLPDGIKMRFKRLRQPSYNERFLQLMVDNGIQRETSL